MILQMAWRNLWRHPRRTILILAAVVVGVWSMVFYSAFIRGFAEELVKQSVANLTGNLQVQAPGFFENPVLEHLMRSPTPAEAALRETLPPGSRWTARLRIGAVMRSPHGAFGATLVGVVPAEERDISFIGGAMSDGAFLPEPGNGIVVGRALLERLEARIGHRLVIDAQRADGRIESRAFTVVGVFRAQIEATEKQFVFCRRETLQAMLGLGDAASELCVVLPRPEDAAPVAAALRAKLPAEDFRVMTWRELIPFVGAYLDNMGIFAFIWNLVVFIAMAFGLVNTILMAVFERVREFGLVRALGVTPRGIVAGVLLETGLLLTLGMLLGAAAAGATVTLLGRTGIDFSAFAAGSEYFGISRVLYPRAEAVDYARACVTVLGLGLAISLYPAVKAARITPVAAMAHV